MGRAPAMAALLPLAMLVAAPARAQTAQSGRWAAVLKASAQAAQGKPSHALSTLARVRRTRDTPALATAAALLHLLRNDLKAATRETRRATRLGGSYVDGHYWSAVIAARAGRWPEASRGLHRAQTLGGDRPHFLMLRVLLEKRAGRQAAAKKALLKLTAKRCELLDPALYPDPMVGLAEAMLHVLRRFPKPTASLVTAGNLMMMTRRYHQARLYYQRARKRLPLNAAVLHRLARLALIDGNAPEALRLTRRGLARTPGAALLRSLQAEALILLGRSTRARSELERVVKANPGSALDLSRLADLLWDSGAFARAEKLYRYALRRHRGLASARYGVARALDRRRKYKQAERSYRAAAALSPSNQRYHLGLALFYDKLGRSTEAKVHHARARRARALSGKLIARVKRARAAGGVARQTCRVVRAAALPAARLILRRFKASAGVGAFMRAHLATLSGRQSTAALATVLAALKPRRLLSARADLFTVLTLKGQIDKQVPVVLKRYLSYLDPDLVR